MERQNANQHIVIQPQSRLDEQSGKVLMQQMVSSIQDHHQLWIIDMTHVSFIDSAGLGVLVSALKSARTKGCKLVLCNLSASAKLLLEITQLDKVFEVFDELDAIFSKQSPFKMA
jgi:anti-anti-sigma factor